MSASQNVKVTWHRRLRSSRWATDAITFIKAMGFQQVDHFGFSMGGMIAQEIALMEPQLVRKIETKSLGSVTLSCWVFGNFRDGSIRAA